MALVVVVMVAAAAVVIGSRDGADPVSQDAPGPVLVVPGYGGSTSSLAPLVAELRKQGRDVVVVAPTDGGTGDLRIQAERLGGAARKAMADSGATSVDVVGYSAGGVIARIWVRDDGGDSIARRVLTLGSPHHGTDVAALAVDVAGSCPTACAQLAPDSDVLRGLNAGDETPAGPRWITIRSTADRTVTPTDSASLDGALNLLVQDVCSTRSTPHSGLPDDPVVLASLVSVLGAATPRAPEGVSC